MNFEAKGELLYTRTRPYLLEKTENPDFTIQIPDSYFEERHKQYPMLTLDECRYMWVGEAFYKALLQFNGLLMHSSCIARDNKAYLFSAKSGTGKSTHTGLWMDVFKDCQIINDDKPAIRKIDGTFYACGTPFSGKDDISENKKVPIRALIFLERNEKNSIEKISPQKAIPLFLSQTIRPANKENMTGMLDILSNLLESVPTFLLKCNMEKDAPIVSFEGIEAYYRDKE